ncbi:MAG: Dna2/Cas4 domain-containing protein [Acidobacteria bacterium]|nr:Dna2/Cas4 domain-containing protein [Acidobacteriota bacterium]MBI3422284.1 Dna2/Cas4 domain-containing protein [Acidobacteriota bacterium]
MTLGWLLLFLFALAVFCWLLARQLRQGSGLLGGEIIYEDASGKNPRVLVSRRYGLRGKPDYLLKDGAGWVIPVELKSGRMPRNGRPYRSHVLQLAVYFLLVEDVLQQEVAYGLVRYQNGALRVRNSKQLRKELLAVVKEMRAVLACDNARRSHQDPRRCEACSMAHGCDERLA